MTRPRTFEFLYENRTVPVPESGCTIWIGAINNKGYGIFRRGIKTLSAHRAAWIMNHGEIGDNLCVLHKCDVRCCVNPDHLYLGTKTDNAADKTKRKRGTIGIKNSHAVLSEIQVREIRELRASGVLPMAIHRKYGISPEHVRRIVNRQAWKHI